MKIFLLTLGVCMGCLGLSAQKRAFYEIKVYHVSKTEQVAQVDEYLKNTYLPALHATGVSKVGVFHHIANDTAADKRIFVFIPLKSFGHAEKIEDLLVKNASIRSSAYWNTAFNQSPYTRTETILLKAFPLMPGWKAPSLSGNKTERIFELRSYESANERLYRKKVEMFNEGGEIALFDRLGFNAVFYGEVIAGSRMPNLMYMTSFNNRKERDEHWAAFSADPEWKKLSAMEEYKNTVQKNDTMLLNPTEFSEL
ncbi:NIPSNAP family protein [Sediminibacterium soli]|uniref:NIPSNAP family protein n=1 Tax=Sediminibacterium soli TaxID=2698829 RepID=UPI00137ABD7A|nr:NIPSNAP family protein [Sediminibacterium soli]NCI45981.1 NIPSNAP family containing protein [Sediminibacterium soli]